MQNSKLICQHELSPLAKQISGASSKNRTFHRSNNDDDDILYVPVNQICWQVTFTKDGIYLAACYGGPEPCIRIWMRCIEKDTTTVSPSSTTKLDRWELQAVLTGIHERTVRSVAFAPFVKNPIILASASFDGSIAIWEQELTTTTTTMNDNPNYNSNKQQWTCAAQLEGHDNEVKCVVWNATGSLLASCGRDKTVWIWECYLDGTIGGSGGNNSNHGGDYECVAVLNGHTADVKCVVFAPSHGEWGDGGDEILLSSSYDDTIKCWVEDTSTGDWYCGATISSVHTSTIWTLTLAPSGTRLLSGSADGSIGIYKSYTKNEKKALLASCNEHERRELLNNSNTSTVNGLWRCIGTLPSVHHNLTVNSISYASTQVGHGRLASCGDDHCIVICRERCRSPNNKTTTSASRHDNETTKPMLLSDETPCYEIEVSVMTPTEINCVCWNPLDGSVLASAHDDGIVRIWNYST